MRESNIVMNQLKRPFKATDELIKTEDKKSMVDKLTALQGLVERLESKLRDS